MSLPCLACDDLPQESPIDLWAAPSLGIQWSHSTHACFRRCQKQYFYGFRMANSQSHDKQRRTAWVLSQLQDLPRWRGRLVDYAIENYVVPALRYGQLPALDDVIAQTLSLARRQWSFSEQRAYAESGLVKGRCGDSFCALFEHEYEIAVGQAELKQVETEVAHALHTLYALPDFLSLLREHQRYQAQYRITFPFEQGRVNAVLDLLCWRGHHRTIVDWKAVENEMSNHATQMLIYAWATLRQWPDLSHDAITLYEVRLMEGKVRQHVVTPERLVDAENLVYQSLSDMGALTGGKSYAEQDITHYEPARTAKTCATCNYRKICLQGGPDH